MKRYKIEYFKLYEQNEKYDIKYFFCYAESFEDAEKRFILTGGKEEDIIDIWEL